MHRYAFAALAVCLALIGIVACSDDDSDSTTAASRQDVCASVADVRQAAGAIGGLDPANTTLSEFQAAATDLQGAVSELTSAASTASGADREALSDAADGLGAAARSAVQALRAGESPQQALARLRAAVVPLEDAAQALGPDCPDGGATTTG